MASVNKVILIGNLGADPEIRYSPQGQAVSNFRIACSESWTDKQGQKQERTEWVRIVAWGKLAELAGEYLQKGRQVYVEGRLQTREWTDKEDRKQWTTEVVANEIKFLGSKPDGAGQSDRGEPRAAAAPAPAGGAVFPPYDKSKGGPVFGASTEDLEYYAAGARRSLADPEKSRWHDKERALLTAIEAEIARQRSAGRGGGVRDDFGPAPSDWQADDDDSGIPF